MTMFVSVSSRRSPSGPNADFAHPPVPKLTRYPDIVRGVYRSLLTPWLGAGLGRLATH